MKSIIIFEIETPDSFPSQEVRKALEFWAKMKISDPNFNIDGIPLKVTAAIASTVIT